ncbi:MAG: acetylxylan esterase [Verrucomicrobia bacterium]|jgi:dienelactone hydrolase|nr:acetylxylan esterase [Verrucomicrobiota bacterium]
MKTLRVLFLFLLGGALLPAAELPGDKALAEYFRKETARISAQNFANIKTLEDWQRERVIAKQQLQEMLGLSPMPEKTDLKVNITGRVEHDQFFVENLHYQSMPGLYVTANLYVPKNLTKKVPAILYVCGHGQVKTNGVSFGNKTAYQHHGEWFARNGYVCLTIDTIQLGELEGIHHGTYREGMWWWNSRGYTPAGVEAWNSIRGLDYLQSRAEVDGEKLGVTGRSGGGGYSWWTAALDDRIKAAVPVAGITDLQNHVVDGCIEGHCDCMFMMNTYRWDYAKVAALIAPRPLLIANTDKDRIFPLDGVVRLHKDVANIYKLYGATNNLGLLITAGPHKDTQELQVPAFRWFNQFLKGEEPLISMPAEKLLKPQELKVFSSLPTDERTTKIHETFVAAAKPVVPENKAQWEKQRAGWLDVLKEKSFRGWPEDKMVPNALNVRGTSEFEAANVTMWNFTSQEGVELPLYCVAKGTYQGAQKVRLHVVDEKGWTNLLSGLLAYQAGKMGEELRITPSIKPDMLAWLRVVADMEKENAALVFLPPRGIGLTAWDPDPRKQTMNRRRFMLLGQTLEGMRVWDIKRALEVLKAEFPDRPIQLVGERNQGINALYASLFVGGVTSVELIEPPASHMTGPDYLNVLRYLDIPQALTMVAEKSKVMVTDAKAEDFQWANEAAGKLGWPQGKIHFIDAKAAAREKARSLLK